MNPFYFGSAPHRLFGIYSPPLARPRSQGVVLCPASGQDYVRSHRVLKALSDELTRNGFHTLRFDYFGCGDSAGEAKEGRIRRWLTDIPLAMNELAAVAGTTKLSVVGVRLGAALALMQPTPQEQFQCAVLWDPIVQGVNFLQLQKSLHEDMIADRTSFRDRGAISEKARTRQLLGFPFPPELEEELRQVDLLTLPSAPTRRCLMIDFQSDAQRALCRRLSELGVDCAHFPSPSAKDWDNLQQLSSLIVSFEVVPAIVDYMCRLV